MRQSEWRRRGSKTELEITEGMLCRTHRHSVFLDGEETASDLGLKDHEPLECNEGNAEDSTVRFWV